VRKAVPAGRIRLISYCYAAVLLILLIALSRYWLAVTLSWFVVGYGVIVAYIFHLRRSRRKIMPPP